MVKGERIAQRDLLKIRSELSKELENMSLFQRKGYLAAAEGVYGGLSRMPKSMSWSKHNLLVN